MDNLLRRSRLSGCMGVDQAIYHVLKDQEETELQDGADAEKSETAKVGPQFTGEPIQRLHENTVVGEHISGRS